MASAKNSQRSTSVPASADSAAARNHGAASRCTKNHTGNAHSAGIKANNSKAMTRSFLECLRAPNRVGHEIILNAKGKPVSKDGIQFWGQSFVAAPNGHVLHRCSVDKDEVANVDCDMAKVEFARTHWPFLRDRRVDAYGGMTKRYGV